MIIAASAHWKLTLRKRACLVYLTDMPMDFRWVQVVFPYSFLFGNFWGFPEKALEPGTEFQLYQADCFLFSKESYTVQHQARQGITACRISSMSSIQKTEEGILIVLSGFIHSCKRFLQIIRSGFKHHFAEAKCEFLFSFF